MFFCFFRCGPKRRAMYGTSLPPIIREYNASKTPLLIHSITLAYAFWNIAPTLIAIFLSWVVSPEESTGAVQGVFLAVMVLYWADQLIRKWNARRAMSVLVHLWGLKSQFAEMLYRLPIRMQSPYRDVCERLEAKLTEIARGEEARDDREERANPTSLKEMQLEALRVITKELASEMETYVSIHIDDFAIRHVIMDMLTRCGLPSECVRANSGVISE